MRRESGTGTGFWERCRWLGSWVNGSSSRFVLFRIGRDVVQQLLNVYVAASNGFICVGCGFCRIHRYLGGTDIRAFGGVGGIWEGGRAGRGRNCTWAWLGKILGGISVGWRNRRR